VTDTNDKEEEEHEQDEDETLLEEVKSKVNELLAKHRDKVVAHCKSDEFKKTPQYYYEVSCDDHFVIMSYLPTPTEIAKIDNNNLSLGKELESKIEAAGRDVLETKLIVIADWFRGIWMEFATSRDDISAAQLAVQNSSVLLDLLDGQWKETLASDEDGDQDDDSEGDADGNDGGDNGGVGADGEEESDEGDEGSDNNGGGDDDE